MSIDSLDDTVQDDVTQITNRGSLSGKQKVMEGEGVHRVYISDSPVNDDSAEYKYVSSDIEEDDLSTLRDDKSRKHRRQQTPGIKSNLQDENEVGFAAEALEDDDDLEKEAEYQRQLQARMQNASLNDDSASKSSSNQNESNSGDTSKSSLYKNVDGYVPPLKLTDSLVADDPLPGTNIDVMDSLDEERVEEVMQWKNPPANPFSDGGSSNEETEQKSQPQQSNNRYNVDDAPEEKFVPQNFQRQLQHVNHYADGNVPQQVYSQHEQQYSFSQPNLQQAGMIDQSYYSNQVYQPHSYTYEQYGYSQGQPQGYYQGFEADSYSEGGQSSFNNTGYSDNPSDQYGYSRNHPPREKKIIRAIPPKPSRPQKNYLEKNKERAVGKGSAKAGYTDKLYKKRIEQEAIKEWAPGMIVPRKKAASADDITRGSQRDEISAEELWKNRSRELAYKKSGQGAKKKNSVRESSLKRYPSEGNVRRSKIPPISSQLPSGYSQSRDWPDDQRGIFNNSRNNPSIQQVLAHSNSKQPNGPIFNQNSYGYVSPTIRQHPNGPIPQRAPPSGPVLQQAYMPSGAIVPTKPVAGPIPQQFPTSHTGPVIQAPLVSPVGAQPVYYQAVSPVYYAQAQNGFMFSSVTQPDPYQAYRQPDLLQQNYQQEQPQASQYDYSAYNSKTASFNYKESTVPASKPLDNVVAQYEGSEYSSPKPSYADVLRPRMSESAPEPAKIKTWNPYSAVPPIHSSDEDAGSYIKAYLNQKEKAAQAEKGPTYKQYTMKDYKRLKLEYKLGGLGPSEDPDTLKEKNEKRLKQLQYAKNAMEQEKKKPHPPPRPRKQDEEEVTQMNSRQLAVEYAKHLPKPKVLPKPARQPSPPPKSRSTSQNQSTIPAMQAVRTAAQSPSRYSTVSSMTPISQIGMADLEELQRRHLEEKRAVAEIQFMMQQTA